MGGGGAAGGGGGAAGTSKCLIIDARVVSGRLPYAQGDSSNEAFEATANSLTSLLETDDDDGIRPSGITCSTLFIELPQLIGLSIQQQTDPPYAARWLCVASPLFLLPPIHNPLHRGLVCTRQAMGKPLITLTSILTARKLPKRCACT